MKIFDEDALVYALIQRSEDAKDLKRVFKAEWLRKKELVPVLNAVYDFIKEFKISPSLASLHEYMEDKDKEKYDTRYKATLTGLELCKFDKTKQILAVKKAKEAAAAYSLDAMIHGPDFQSMLGVGHGDGLLREVSRWLGEHTQADGELTRNIKDAFDDLIDNIPWDGKSPRLATGIECIDEWTYGGPRPGEVGIVMAPTGNGKSAILMNIAHHIAVVEQRSVLFVTNELTLGEQAERFLARMQAPERNKSGSEIFHTLQEIQEDPSVAYRGLDRKWLAGVENRLFIATIDLGTTADQIEDQLSRMRAEHGFVPQCVVIDFMERMAPSSRVSRDREWIYFGEIAKELKRLAKRRKTVIWTAIQTNRQGLNRGVALDMSQAQGSIRHLQEADILIAARKVYVEMDAEGNHRIECLAFRELKQRHNRMEEREVNLRVMLERMVITKEQIIPPSDEAIIDADDDDDTPKMKPKIKSQKEVKSR